MMAKKLLALLLAATLLLGLTACGKSGESDSVGKYICIAVAYDGENFMTPDVANGYVELKKGGKGTVSDELSFDITWKLDGETFTGSYKIFGMEAPLAGTLKDGLLELKDGSIVTRYLKEGMEIPDWAKNLESGTAQGRLAGYYTLFAMRIGEDYYDYAALVEMGEMDNSYLQIDYDSAKGYTGELCFDGEEPDSFFLDEQLGVMTFSDTTQTLYEEPEDGVIGVEFGELNATIFYALDSVEKVAASETAEAPENNTLLDWWNGDWYGWWFMYGCKGDYESLEGSYWDCEAHIEIDPDTYTGTMELWDDEMYQNMGGIGMVDVSLSDSGTGEYGTLMSEGGWFMEMELAHADWIIDPGLTDFENMLVITGGYDDDNGNVYSFKIMIRPWGQLWEDVAEESRPWSYENWYKPMIEDGVTKMSVRFGDPDPSAYEDLEQKNTEAEETETGAAVTDYGKSNADATGEMELEKLKSCFETWRSSDNKYDMLYEDVRDLMGCDGCPYRFDEKYHSYTWESGNVIVTATFKIQPDGSETCNSMVISGV